MFWGHLATVCFRICPTWTGSYSRLSWCFSQIRSDLFQQVPCPPSLSYRTALGLLKPTRPATKRAEGSWQLNPPPVALSQGMRLGEHESPPPLTQVGTTLSLLPECMGCAFENSEKLTVAGEPEEKTEIQSTTKLGVRLPLFFPAVPPCLNPKQLKTQRQTVGQRR